LPISDLTVASNPKAYFDRSAEQYARRSAALLWNWQGKRELSAVQNLMGDIANVDVLDLGCGAGYYTRHCLNQGARTVTAVDFSANMIDHLPKEKVIGIVADASKVELESMFSVTICAGLLEFVASPEDVLNNARRSISPEGRMVCLVPPENLAGKLYHKFHLGHGLNISLFSPTIFEQMARESGWKIEAQKFVFPYARIYRLKAA
jgi:2-polyprenyl-3-methyl-5-hydroxy-6-metoxy-1,4-benzoquinol methylase